MRIEKQNNKSQTIFIILFSVLFFMIIPKIVVSKTLNKDQLRWDKIDTKHTFIYYQCLKDLENFNRKINFKTSQESFDIANSVSDKIDAIFKKSQQLLGMQGFVNKITIKIFKNKQQLDRAYFKIYKKDSNSRAWYTHEKLTVFIQLNDIHRGMIAHELAHAIIDHYLIIPPPKETAEILARYVDTHMVDSMSKKDIGNIIPANVQGYSAK